MGYWEGEKWVAYWCMPLLLSLIFFSSLLVSLFSSFFVFVPFSSLFFIFLPFLLCTSMAFYTTFRDKIYHFYHLTTFGLLWVSFQDCPLVCWLPSHHHYTVLAMSCLILDKSGFVLFFTSLGTPIRIKGWASHITNSKSCT